MSFIKTLKDARGTTSKLDILKGANARDRQIFKYAYDKNLTFGVTFDSINWDNIKDDESDLLIQILDNLASRAISGNLAREVVNNHANVYGDLIKLICNKDLDCGVSYGLLELAFGKDLIGKFTVQLAKEVPIEKLKYPLLAQIKYDGVRVVAIVKNGEVLFRTRNGKSFKCPIIAEQIKGLKDENYILDGEFVVSAGLSIGRTSISGLVNSAIHGGVLSGASISYAIFDYMSLEDFENCKCNRPYNERYANIPLLLGCPNLIIAETKIVKSAEEANKYYTEVLSCGYEGLILKSEHHKYTFKRTADWVKVKATRSVELLCSGIEEGTGKYEGMIGALCCYGLIDGKNIGVNVGSGLTDSDRAMHEDAYLGKKIEVKYNDVIKDSKTGQWSLFLPRFVAVRGDL